MIVKCSVDRCAQFDSTHKNELVNMDFVASFRKSSFYKHNISFSFKGYVYGNSHHYWLYESAEDRDRDFEKLLELSVHKL